MLLGCTIRQCHACAYLHDFSPGRNMRLAGLGVVLVCMNMLRCCWSCAPAVMQCGVVSAG